MTVNYQTTWMQLPSEFKFTVFYVAKFRCVLCNIATKLPSLSLSSDNLQSDPWIIMGIRVWNSGRPGAWFSCLIWHRSNICERASELYYLFDEHFKQWQIQTRSDKPCLDPSTRYLHSCSEWICDKLASISKFLNLIFRDKSNVYPKLAFWRAFKRKKIDFDKFSFVFWLRMIEELWRILWANGFPNIQE